MKVASVEWRPDELEEIRDAESLIHRMKYYMESASSAQTDIIVFPAFTGCLYGCLKSPSSSLDEHAANMHSEEYLSRLKDLSHQFKLGMCPGSYWSKSHDGIYHESCILYRGEVLLEQRQIYLARWEKSLGLARGCNLNITEFHGWKLAVILPTDTFYPQVSRMAALSGVDIVLSPAGFIGEENKAMQLSGLWKDVQQNQFFAVESGFNGSLYDVDFWGESVIHAPLEMTEEGKGFLERSKGTGRLIIAELDNEKRKKAISRFNVLAQLNPELYGKMQMFGGRL